MISDFLKVPHAFMLQKLKSFLYLFTVLVTYLRAATVTQREYVQSYSCGAASLSKLVGACFLTVVLPGPASERTHARVVWASDLSWMIFDILSMILVLFSFLLLLSTEKTKFVQRVIHCAAL